MKNITLKIDDETYRKARVRAAQEGTSISAMVKEFLAKQAGEEDERENHRIAGGRGQARTDLLKPLTRDEIYAERLR